MGVKITDTTLRDAHQSLMATRLRAADVLPVAGEMDRVGFFSLEAWGGATFDSCIRFLNEDPWERLRTFKAHIPNTPLQMLLRGQNLVGYRHYADDVVEEFVRLAIRNGVRIFRIFDALNDIRNMTAAIQAVKKGKAHVQGAICYTVSPVHTIEKLRRDGCRAGEDRLRFHLHQGHGRPDHPQGGLRLDPSPPRKPSNCPSTCTATAPAEWRP